MTDRELIDELIKQNEKISEALKLSTDVVNTLTDRLLKLEKEVYSVNK